MSNLMKACPECCKTEREKTVCNCGHSFVLKPLDKTRKSKRIAMRCNRALESPSKTMTRHEQVRAYTAKKRALENQSETMARREQDRAYTAKKRALETPSETITRREEDRVYTAKKRAISVSIDNAIASFQSKAKMGPDFVCTVCHHMMYKQNVVPCKISCFSNRGFIITIH